MKRTPLRRRAQLRAREPLRRTTPLQRTPALAATESQRAAVAGRPCIACGATHRIDPAHLIPRSLGGCGDPLCVVPACGPRRVRVRRVDLDSFLAAAATVPDERRPTSKGDGVEARGKLAQALSLARVALDGEDEPGLAGALRELAAAADRLAGVLEPG